MHDAGSGGLIVVTERLGWPPARLGWRRWIPWETQTQMVYDDHSEDPTATCHLQRDLETPALCGYPWECLVPVPASPDWTDLHPEIRCAECSDVAGIRTEDPAGHSYHYRWE